MGIFAALALCSFIRAYAALVCSSSQLEQLFALEGVLK